MTYVEKGLSYVYLIQIFTWGYFSFNYFHSFPHFLNDDDDDDDYDNGNNNNNNNAGRQISFSNICRLYFL
jgi:hypothetical protein